jgi:heme-degrading monooxygenase HmoA
MDAPHDLAQVNIMRLRAPLDGPELAAFVAALAPVNAVADGAPGFVWRLQTAAGDSTAMRIFDDDTLLVNMSTWRSLEALTDYVYRSAHKEIMRRRREFAIPMGDAYAALWWVPRGHHPTVAEAEERLQHLRAHGPTPFAFGVRAPFPPPAASVAPQPVPSR